MGFFFPSPTGGTGSDSGTGTRGETAENTSALAIPGTLTDVKV